MPVINTIRIGDHSFALQGLGPYTTTSNITVPSGIMPGFTITASSPGETTIDYDSFWSSQLHDNVVRSKGENAKLEVSPELEEYLEDLGRR